MSFRHGALRAFSGGVTMSQRASAVPQPPSTGKLSVRIRNRWQLYIFLLIPVAQVLIFKYWPMLGLQIAFKNFDYRLGIWGSAWVGTKHFQRFLNSYQFSRVVGNTLRLSLYSLLAGFPLPVIFALLLNAMPLKKYKKIVQTVTYMPHFISVVVMVGIITQMMNIHVGLYGQLYKSLMGKNAPDVLGMASAFPHMYVWSGIWQNIGFNSIIYVAALSSVDPELHEAAEMDGANRFSRLIHIDLPTILPTASIMLILACGNIMSVGFEKAYLMQNTLNISRSEVISTYVYKIGIASGGGNFSFGTAVGLFNSVVNFILIVLVNLISKKLGGNSLW